MAKKVVTKKSRVSVVKKRWYPVLAPAVFNSVEVGQTLAADTKLLVGRGIRTTLGNVQRGGKKGNLALWLRISALKGSECQTEFIGLELLNPQVKRLVKRAKKRFDASFIVVTKDEVKVRLKPVLFVKRTVQRGVLTALRHETEAYYTAQAKEMSFSEFVGKVIQGDLQRTLRSDLKKVYPVHTIEMRAMHRV